MLIRQYAPSDCRELTELFYNTVHQVNAKDYTKEQLDILNKYETSLGKNITSWLVNRITSKSSPTESDWQNNLLKTNRTSIEEVKRVNQAAYDKYLEAINK